jgi:short-subunit dehydrogenase involved in D-alanine esterification of teichoic acids
MVYDAAIIRAHDYSNSFTLGQDRSEGELQTNLIAPIELTRLFLRERQPLELNPKGGVIVDMNTPGALFPLVAAPLYRTTKAGLRMFTLALRRNSSGRV